MDKSFDELCKIIRDKNATEQYTYEELKQIRDFLDGLKEEEVRGAFRARFVDRMDANVDKEESKGGGK